ncbi:AAA family ATPase [Alicyclobacillus curvatus]|nr:AAA family ATPase [Alicyclobacillus curvatus]
MSGIRWVGRLSEVQLLDQAVAQLADGKGGIVLIGGEAGIGKTTLVTHVLQSHLEALGIGADHPEPSRPVADQTGSDQPEVIQTGAAHQGAIRPMAAQPEDAQTGADQTRASLQGPSHAHQSVQTLTCRCPGPGETPPYGPWREAFLYLQMTHPDWDASLLPAPFGSSSAVTDPFEIALLLLRWFRQLGRPLVITIDDLQWSDRASLDLLRQLSGRLRDIPLLIIGVYRSEDARKSPDHGRVFADLLRTGSRRIVLHEMNRTEVGELTRLIMPDSENSVELAAEIYRLTHGLPLFVVELLEQFKRSPQTNVLLAETVQQAIDSKLNMLDEAYIPVMEEAAQIGEQFSWALLLTIASGGREDVSAALTAAKQIGLIWQTPENPDVYQFRHAIIRDVLQHRMFGVRLEYCHRRIAAALEVSTPDAYDVIAFHYRVANDPRSVRFLLLAADTALQMGALMDAADRYRQALELQFPASVGGGARGAVDGAYGADLAYDAIAAARVSGEASAIDGANFRAEILLKLGFCLRRRNEAEAVDCLETALKSSEDTNDEALLAWGRHFLYEQAYTHGHAVSLHHLSALSDLQDRLLENERYQTLEKLFYGGHFNYPRIVFVYWSFLYAQGLLVEAEQVLTDLERRAGAQSRHVLSMKSRLNAFMGKVDESIAIVKAMSKAAYRQHDDWTATLLATNDAYHTYLVHTHQPEVVDAALEELLALERDVNDRNGFGFIPKPYSAAGFFHYTRGDWDEGRRHLVDYVLAEVAPDPLITWFAAVMLVETADFAHLDGVLAKLAPLRPSDPPPPSTTVFTWVHATRAQAHLLRSEVDLAREWLEAADAHPLSQVSRMHRPLIDIAWTDYYVQTGDTTKALEACQRALSWAESVPIPWFVVKSRRRLGEIFCESGRLTEAYEALDAASALAEICRLPYETALCSLSAGRVWTRYIRNRHTSRTHVSKQQTANWHMSKEPKANEHMVNQPVVNQHMANRHMSKEPVVTEPVVNQHMANWHMSKEPVVTEPVTTAETLTDEKWNRLAQRGPAIIQGLQTAKDIFARLGAREEAEAETLLQAIEGDIGGPQAAADGSTGRGDDGRSLPAAANGGTVRGDIGIDTEMDNTSPPLSQAPTKRGASSAPGGLTDREWEVARLVADGLTDKEVAGRLYVSPRTVDHHLRSVFRKLGLRHRTALAAYLNKQGE